MTIVLIALMSMTVFGLMVGMIVTMVVDELKEQYQHHDINHS